MSSKLAACVKLSKRMPPIESEKTLNNLTTLTGKDMEESLCQNIDVPLGVMMDPKAGKKFITCNYNRDGNSYRSPHSSQYFPPTDSKFQPSHALRLFEVKANKAFDIYRELYFKGGVSSVYCWDLADRTFASCWACRNNETKDGANSQWSEIHVFEVRQKFSSKVYYKIPGVIKLDNVSQKVSQRFSYDYKLTTTVIMQTEKVDTNGMRINLSGTKTLQKAKSDVLVTKVDVDDHHVAVMGRMAEELSSKLRASLAGVYCPKGNQIMSYLHQNQKDRNRDHLEALRQQMRDALGKSISA